MIMVKIFIPISLPGMQVQSLNLDAEFDLQITFLEALKGTKKNILVNYELIEIEIPKGIQSVK